MDSFYDAPRQPPVLQHLKLNNFDKSPTLPAVPDISILDNSANSQPRFFPNGAKPYNPTFSDFSKKQVRFENPTLTPPLKKFDNTSRPPQNGNFPNPNLKGKTFEQIYMANVPNRHLDLSILEPPSKENQPSDATPITEHLLVPQSYKESQFSNRAVAPNRLDSFLDDSLREMRSHNRKSIENTAPLETRNHYQPLRSIENSSSMETRTQYISRMENQPPMGHTTEIAPRSDEPTMKDLFHMMQKQNEQIMMLQQQVNDLKSNINRPQIDQYPEEYRSPFLKELTNSPTTKSQKFSIDLKATSFEVSFRPQQHKFRKNDFEPKIQEIVETDNIQSEPNQNSSLRLEESLNVRDSYVSAVPSIQINMEEYQSSEEEDSGSDNIGVTFYKDLMNQVNTALKKMKIQSECQMGANRKCDLAGQTMNAVKQATLQHLRNMGVNLPPIQESNEMAWSASSSQNGEPTEVSFAVKQLLMKYLPDDKLAKAINSENHVKKQNHLRENKPKTGEFSFATIEYMKKYNILNSNNRDHARAAPPLKKPPTDNPKILDVTALKLQPKLL